MTWNYIVMVDKGNTNKECKEFKVFVNGNRFHQTFINAKVKQIK